jgi:biotin transporter BioY
LQKIDFGGMAAKAGGRAQVSPVRNGTFWLPVLSFPDGTACTLVVSAYGYVFYYIRESNVAWSDTTILHFAYWINSLLCYCDVMSCHVVS